MCLMSKVRTNNDCTGWSDIGLQVNLILPWRKMGEPPERGRSVQQHATYSIPFESFIMNTGDFLWDAKGSGE
jgi:hypothetical protein